MVDFIQNKNNKDSEAVKQTRKIAPTKNKAQRTSWLRGLLHPVNGNKVEQGTSIDLLVAAGKQIKDLSSTVKSPVGDKGIVPARVDAALPKKLEKQDKPLAAFRARGQAKKKELAKEGSDKVRKGFDVNLLPITFRFLSTNKIVSLLTVWIVLALVVLGVFYIGISFYGQQVTEEGLTLEAEIEYLDSEIVKYNGDLSEASKWQIKLSAVDSLLKSHVYWTNFFSVLEKITLPSVYYSGFTASLVNSDINLVSYADSFSTVAKQLIAYERFPEVLSNFSVAEASLDEGIGINYNALVSLRRSLFYDSEFIKGEDK